MWYAISLINTVLIHWPLGRALFSPTRAINWINFAIIYRLKSRALNLLADMSRYTTYDVQADTVYLRVAVLACMQRDSWYEKRYHLHDYRTDWRELIPLFFPSRAGHARPLSHASVYIASVAITTSTFQSIMIKRSSLYNYNPVWRVSNLIRRDEGYPAEPVSPGEIIFRGWL